MDKLTIAIAAIREETALSTLDHFKEFLADKIVLDEDMQAMFAEFKATIPATYKAAAKAEAKVARAAKKLNKLAAAKDNTTDPPAEKKKRAPSQYNLYIKAKMAEFKEQGHTGNLMKMAIEAWKEEKAHEIPEPSDPSDPAPPSPPANQPTTTDSTTDTNNSSTDAEQSEPHPPPPAKSKRGRKKQVVPSDTE
jgi:hypothetical protein